MRLDDWFFDNKSSKTIQLVILILHLIHGISALNLWRGNPGHAIKISSPAKTHWSSSPLNARPTGIAHRERRNPTSSRVRAMPASSPTFLAAAAGSFIPLWAQCALAPNEVCNEDARCICKDQWWSQCRLPINGSWTPSDEVWDCSRIHHTTNFTVPLSTDSVNILSRSAKDAAISKPLSLLSISSTPTSSNPLSVHHPTAGPLISASSMKPTQGMSTKLTHKSFNWTESTSSRSPNRSPAVSTSPSSQPELTRSSDSLYVASLSSLRLLNASAYANPFVISVSSHPRIVSSNWVESSSSPVTIADGLPTPSKTSLPPNLACPASSVTEDPNETRGTDSVAIEACDSNMSMNPGNLSSTTNSSATPAIALQSATDPDKDGTYLDSVATTDQQSHCHNIAAHQYQVCWEVLNVTGYIRDWVAFNQNKCDDEGMGFADCFLYIEVGDGANCSSFTARSQCPSPDTRDFTGRHSGAQRYYVAFNIWNIQNWFFTYYMAVGGANGLTAESIATIAQTLNVQPPKSFSGLELLSVLAFAFGLLSPSGYAATLPYLGQKLEGLAAQAPGEYLLRAIQNAPTLSRNLLGASELGKPDLQVAELGSDLARIVAQLETNIQNSVVLVASNFSLFFDFVKDGFFSTQIENLNTLTQNVTLSLNTYVVSQALQMDDVIITRALDTDINELQLNGSANGYDTGCGHGYDEWGMCSNWWYDNTNRISYGLESQKDMLNNYSDPLESLFNQGLTTPELLFKNSQLCADTAGSTQGNAPGTSLSTTTGVWNTECISNMKICTWDLVNLGVFNEFTDCPRESSFAMEECGAGEEVVQWTVPASYIGPYLTSPLVEGVVCNQWGKGMGNPG